MGQGFNREVKSEDSKIFDYIKYRRLLINLLIPRTKRSYEYRLQDSGIVYNDEVNELIENFWTTLTKEVLSYIDSNLIIIKSSRNKYSNEIKDEFTKNEIDRRVSEFNNVFNFSNLELEFCKIIEAGVRAKKSQDDFRWRRYLHESELYVISRYSDEDFNCIMKNTSTDSKIQYVRSIIGPDKFDKLVYFNAVILYYYRAEAYKNYMPEFLYYLKEKLDNWYGIPYEEIKSKLPEYIDGEHIPDDFLNWSRLKYGSTKKELNPTKIDLTDESDRIDLHFEVPKFDI